MTKNRKWMNYCPKCTKNHETFGGLKKHIKNCAKTRIKDYIKEEYLVILNSGEKVLCWPNAGRFNALDKSDREFWQDDIESYTLLTKLI